MPQIWVDELLIYDSNDDILAGLAKDIESSSNGTVKSHPISVASDVKDVFEFYNNLKQITFYTHGTPGHVYFGPRSNFGAHEVLKDFNPRPTLFAPGEGRVLFAGCNVGDEKRGEVFLICVGQKLLKGHGGIVGGSENKTYYSSFSDFRTFPWDTFRLIRVDPQGNVLANKEI